jgi:hypothetical protein
MLRNAFRLCVLSVAVVWLWVGLAHADDKKAGDKPKDGKIVLVIDASKLPPGLLKQLLPYAERPSTEKAEGKPKHAETKAKPPAKAAVAEAKKPNIVQVDLNKLSRIWPNGSRPNCRLANRKKMTTTAAARESEKRTMIGPEQVLKGKSTRMMTMMTRVKLGAEKQEGQS